MEEKKKVNAYEKLIEGIENIIDSGKYKEFLKSMKYFHSYSFRNRLLIYNQNPDATRVAGYSTWKKLGRGVKSNPKKIFIVRPIIGKNKKEHEKDKNTVNQEDNQDVKDMEEEKSISAFGWTLVYDISDTYLLYESKIVPLFDDITLNNSSSEELYHILERVSPVKIDIESTYNGSDGYYSEKEKRIVISSRVSQDDATTILLHEISHSLYDDFDYAKERDMSEMLVESIAFIVADYYGLDTSKSSFSYITKWSKGDSKKLLKLGTKIQEASDDLISKIEKELNKGNESKETKIA